MSYKDSKYFHIGRAQELQGKDRILYRFLEMVPGILSIGTILVTIFLSRKYPTVAAIFIIIFDLYWLLKTIYLSAYLRRNWRRTKHNLKINWQEMLSNMKYEHIHHLVILPFYNEEREIIENGVRGILSANVDHSKIIVVLAGEEKAGEEGKKNSKEIFDKHAKSFGFFLSTIHPMNIPGELQGKGSNITYAAKQAQEKILDANNIPYENVIVSAFDIDTIVYPDYFLCLTWNFLASENPFQNSYQPVPLYNNNIWDAPIFSRVVSGSGTFWQMIQQERPEKLATFSSHALPFKTLVDINYWQTNVVSEDSRIFWNAFVAFNGEYKVTPLSYPVSMDANLAPTFWQTMKNIYRQQRRWMWGSENVPYILFSFIKNKSIPLGKKIKMALIQMEGYWSLATNPLMILLLGWLPLILGGRNFNRTVLSYNLPIITRDLMILAMSGLIISAIIFVSLLPPPNRQIKVAERAMMFLQWLLIPITIIIFGAIPALDAQIRLMIGRYMGFWITPKFIKKQNNLTSKEELEQLGQ